MNQEVREAAKLIRCHEKFGRSGYELFRDFVEASFNALFRNLPLVAGQGEMREAAYMQISERYCGHTRSAAVMRELFPALLGLCSISNTRKEDFLGALAMEVDVLNRHQGQFFTPASIAALSARLQLDKGLIEEWRAAGKPIRIHEPACGAGIMLIEAARYLEEIGVDLSTEVIVSAIDISPMAFHMASIQLTLCNIPAVIFLGNGLSSNIEESCSDKVMTRILADRIKNGAEHHSAPSFLNLKGDRRT